MAKPILIIDPGHGGKDPGGGSNKYWQEKNMVLDISLYQYNRYKELGVPVSITRTKDVYLSPEARTKIVRDSGAEYCHSNHINAGGGQGAEVIHSIHSDGVVSNKIAESLKEVGQNVRRVFTRKLDSGQDYYFMHRETGTVQTDIIEYGFADNATDTKRIKDNWKVYAESIVKAFCEHINHKYVDPGKGDKKVDESVKIETGGLNNVNLIKVIDFFREKKWYGQATIDWKEGSPKLLSGGLSAAMREEYEGWLKAQGFWYKVIE